MNNKISVIIPAYRSELYIADVIGDIFAQTYTNWELIVVSNGTGQDAQLAIIENIIKNCTQANKIIILCEECGSVSLARNIGIDHATGEWLTFVDADDRLDANHLELFFNAMRTDEPDIVVGGYRIKSFIKNSEVCKRFPEADERGVKYLLTIVGGDLLFPSWNKLFRTSFVRGSNIRYNPIYTYFEDGIVVLEWLLSTNAIKIIPMTGYLYAMRRTQDNSFWHYHASLAEAISVLDIFLGKLMLQAGYTEEEIDQQRSRRCFNNKYLFIMNMFRHGSPYTFYEKRAEVKRILFDDADVRELVKAERKRGHNLMQRCFLVCCAVRSPTAVVLLFYAKNAILPFIWHLRSILYTILSILANRKIKLS